MSGIDLDEYNKIKQNFELQQKRLQQDNKKIDEKELEKILYTININLLIPEELEVVLGTEFDAEGNALGNDAVVLKFYEFTIYELFKYITLKEQDKTLTKALVFALGKYSNRYLEIIEKLNNETKKSLIEICDKLNRLDDLFKPLEKTEKDLKELTVKNYGTYVMLGKSILFFCEEWGKMPEEVIKSLTYRQYNWFISLAVLKNKEMEERIEQNSNTNKGMDRDFAEQENLKKFKEKFGDDVEATKVYKSINNDGSKITSPGNVGMLDRSSLKAQGFKCVEEGEGAIVFRKSEQR